MTNQDVAPWDIPPWDAPWASLYIQSYSAPWESSPEQAPTPARSAKIPYSGAIYAAAQKNGIHPLTLAGVLAQESGFNPRAIGDHNHSWGMGQFNQFGAAKDYGLTREQILNMEPEQQIALAADFLGKLKRRRGSDDAAIVAYNGGGDPNYLRNVKIQIRKFGDINLD